MLSSPQPWQVLSALPAWHVTEVSRPEGGHASDAGDQGAEERVAALASAYGCDAPITVAWIRDRPGGPVRVLAGGPALAGGCDGGQAVLTLPSGARGIPLGDGEAARTLAALPCWTRIAGVTDVLLAEAREQQPGQQAVPPSLERGLLSAWLDAFAWLLLAEPADPGLVTEMAADVARAQLEAEQYHSPRAELAARRSAARHNELREAGTSGLWRVHLLAGAATADAAARVARLVAASADLRGLPYGLAPRPVTGSLPDTLIAASGNLPTSGRAVPPVTQPDAGADRSWWDTPMTPGPWDDPASADSRRQWPQSAPGPALAEASRRAEDERDTLTPQSPFYASTRLVATLARAPARELPGLRFTLRPQFDVTPETTPTFTSGDSSGVTAGTVLDANRIPAGPITLPLASLNRHVFVTGATGAGKSQTIRGLLEQAAHTGIPWLVVEPAKAEYRLMAARLRDAQVIRIRPGDLDVSPAGLNPLEPARGPGGDRFPLQAHADLVRDLFLAAFQADEPFPQVLAAALTRCYEQAGWDMVTGAPTEPGMRPAYPGLEDLQATALQVVEDIGYGREVADNVRGFVQVRIHSLRLGTSGRFLDGGHPLDFGALLNRNVVFEIEDAGDDHDKAFLMGAVLIRLTEHLRLRHRAEGPTAPRLRHLTVIEEAHRLLRQPPPGTGNGPAAHAVEMFADLLAEVRAYGEGLIIAEQIPAKLIPDAIKNTAVKVVHRLPAADDRETVGATMNLTESQSQYLVTLVPGEAAVFADGMDYPILARMPDGTVREITTTANAESPAALVGRRSVTCGPDCLAMPCTLRQMRAAQNTAERDPRIILWAELSVLAHLTGWTMPVPGQVFAAALDKMDQRLRDCALSHTVDAAIAARAPAITTRVDGPALAIHIVDAMRARLDNGRWLCASEEPQWLAPPYRWAPLLDHLRDWCADHPGGGPHPSTRDWEAATGRVIPSDTSAAQLDAVQAWHDASQRDSKQVHAALFGTRPVSAIEQAIGARADHPDWTRRLADAFTAFLDCRWPIDLLRAAT